MVQLQLVVDVAGPDQSEREGATGGRHPVGLQHAGKDWGDYRGEEEELDREGRAKLLRLQISTHVEKNEDVRNQLEETAVDEDGTEEAVILLLVDDLGGVEDAPGGEGLGGEADGGVNYEGGNTAI